MNRSRVEDLETGFENERQVKETLERVFGCNLNKERYAYAVIDFANDDKTVWVETKRRLVDHNDYDTAIISKWKVDHCDREGCEYYFTWVYNDGLYGMRYDKALFDTFDVRLYKRKDRVDHKQEPKPHYFIPYRHLKMMAPAAAPQWRGRG
jgi:hypothetical protein